MNDHLALLLTIVAADWLSLVTPGPNFLLVTQETMLRSRGHGMCAGLGITTGSLLWCFMVVFGLDEAFRLLPWLSPTLRSAGAVYLAYLGVKLWLHTEKPQMKPAEQPVAVGSLSRAYAMGVLISLTNPTAVAYYAGMFSDLLRPSEPRWVLPTAVTLIGLGSLVWNLALSYFFSTDRIQRVYARVWRPLTRAASIAMLAFGLQVAVSTV